MFASDPEGVPKRVLAPSRRVRALGTRCWRSVFPLVAVALAVLVSACGSSASSTPPTTSSTVARTDSAGTVWLCRPGLASNPCTSSLTATVVRSDGKKTIQRAVPAPDPPIDCFYVYPTASRQPTENANLHIDPVETAVAIAQASRFSKVCRVYAPMYPQLTLSAIGAGGKKIDPHAAAVAYIGLLAAWKDYLAHDNDGRGVVLIGHSQGASMLIALIHNEVDPNPAERHLLVSALLMGGNVTVPVGQAVGGDFKNIPACAADTQTGCVVAYSSFDTPPPPNGLFGRVGTSLSAQSGLSQQPNANLQVLCTNPASLSGGSGSLTPYFVTKPHPGDLNHFSGDQVSGITTPWVTYPGLYTGTCESTDGATWLQISTDSKTGDHRPVVTETLGPRWGLHLSDINIALGNLVDLVGHQAAAYASSTSER